MTKGNIPLDMIIIAVVMAFVISFTVILAHTLNTDIMDATSDNFNQTVLNQTTKTLLVFDSGIPFIFFGFILAMILLAWYLRSTPILAIILIMTVAVVVIIGASISNSYYDVARTDSLVNASNQYGYTTYLNENLPLFLGVVGFIAVIFLFAKPKGVSL